MTTPSFPPDVTYLCMNEGCAEFGKLKTVTLPELAENVYWLPQPFCSVCLNYMPIEHNPLAGG